jgi:hypothetical protein
MAELLFQMFMALVQMVKSLSVALACKVLKKSSKRIIVKKTKLQPEKRILYSGSSLHSTFTYGTTEGVTPCQIYVANNIGKVKLTLNTKVYNT